MPSLLESSLQNSGRNCSAARRLKSSRLNWLYELGAGFSGLPGPLSGGVCGRQAVNANTESTALRMEIRAAGLFMVASWGFSHAAEDCAAWQGGPFCGL